MEPNQQKEIERLLAYKSDPELALLDELAQLTDNVKDIAERLKGVPVRELEALKGEDGYTPKRGEDYYTEDEQRQVQQAVQDNAVAFLKGEVELMKDALRTELSPIKGIDYDDGRDGMNGIDGITPVKGVDYFTDEDINDIVLSSVNYLEALEGDARLDASAIKNLEKNIDPSGWDYSFLTLDAKQIRNLPKIPDSSGAGGGNRTLKWLNDIVNANEATTGQVLSKRSDGRFEFISAAGLGDLLAANNLSDLADAATARTNLGLAIGTDVQAYDAMLASLATLDDPNADRIAFWDDSAGALAWLTIGTGLSLTGTTLTAAGTGTGDVVGPASAVDGNIVLFDTTTGKLIKDSTKKIADLAASGDLASYVAKATYDAHSILYATTDNTPAALTVGEQTLVGRVTGGNIAAIAIDSDLSSVSASDDTVPSAKAVKAALDAKAPLASPTFTGTVTLPVGLTGVLRADTGVVSVDTDVTDLVSAASETVQGKAELATTAEVVTGTDTSRAVTPAGVTAHLAAPKPIGSTTPNTGKFTTVETTGNIELGHASDTTVSRVSAGVIAIEGNNVITANITASETVKGIVELATTTECTTGTDTERAVTPAGVKAVGDTKLPLAGGTMTGNITLGENASVDLDPALSADGKYSGTCITGTAGAALAFGDVVYFNSSSKWVLADADTAAAGGSCMLGVVVLAASGDTEPTKVLLHGNVRADTAFPTFTVGGAIYLSTTDGDVTQTAPTGADDVVRVVGHALTADSMVFMPSPSHITHTG